VIRLKSNSEPRQKRRIIKAIDEARCRLLTPFARLGRSSRLSIGNSFGIPHPRLENGGTKMIRKMLVAASALSMAVAPISAQAAARHSSPTHSAEHAAGVSTLGWVIAIAIVAGVVAVVASDNHHHPVSP
jgi:hypothetical protein